MRRGLASKWTEHELVTVEQIDANPRVVGHPRLQCLDRTGHRVPGVGDGSELEPEDSLDGLVWRRHQFSRASHKSRTRPPARLTSISRFARPCARPNSARSGSPAGNSLIGPDAAACSREMF